MKKIQVTEILTEPCDTTSTLIREKIKITNTSSDYIHDLKLFIDDKDHELLEQLVTRERGALSFSPDTTCLELGNLAPDESAYYEYKYNAHSNPTSFKHHISLSYAHLEDVPSLQKKIVEFFSESTNK